MLILFLNHRIIVANTLQFSLYCPFICRHLIISLRCVWIIQLDKHPYKLIEIYYKSYQLVKPCYYLSVTGFSLSVALYSLSVTFCLLSVTLCSLSVIVCGLCVTSRILSALCENLSVTGCGLKYIYMSPRSLKQTEI